MRRGKIRIYSEWFKNKVQKYPQLAKNLQYTGRIINKAGNEVDSYRSMVFDWKNQESHSEHNTTAAIYYGES